jgi:hypothetical protein
MSQQNNSYFYGKRNTTGRPVNAKNKVTAAVKDALPCCWRDNLDLLQDDIDQLKPYERINYSRACKLCNSKAKAPPIYR